MPTTFSFSDATFGADDYLTLSQLTPGNYAGGINDPGRASAVAPFQATSPAGDVDLIAVTLVAGRAYTFDIDDGAGDASGGSVDLAFDLIDARGNLLRRVDDGPALSGDPGSFSRLDPGATLSVSVTGTYYIAVHSGGVRYLDSDDEQFRFTGTGGTGDWRLNVSSTGVPGQVTLSGAANALSFSNLNNNIDGAGGNDTLYLNGGQDIGAGGAGNDRLFGGSGEDELSGGTGYDRLYGGTSADVLVGGEGRDSLYGGDGNDALNGGAGLDVLEGGFGNDVLLAGTGADAVYGQGGNDYLRGGAGIDQLWGGTGADRFHFLRGDLTFDANGAAGGFAEDSIRDFELQDTIDLSDVTAADLTFRGSGGFTAAFQVRVLDLGPGGFQEVQINLDTNRTPELAFLVDTVGNFGLIAADFDL